MNMKKMAVVTFAFFVLLGSARVVDAASLYIDPAFPTLNMGDSVTLAVRLDTDEEADECVNAVDGVLTYSENLSPVDVSIGDSIFSMWVEQPKIDKEKRTITFAGGIPNGYCGRVPGDPRLTNTIVQLIFSWPGFTIGGPSGPTTGTVEFLPETAAYLNDGFGTKAELALYGTSVELGDSPGSQLQDPWREAVVTDTIGPAPFGIVIEKIPAETGKYYAIFNTTDKQTGIDQYQIIEEPLDNRFSFDWGRADAPWVTTRSPHLLNDQSLNSVIRVKAIDKAGNEYIATLVPDENLRTVPLQQTIWYAALAFAGLVFLVTAAFIFWRYRRKHVRSTEEVESHN